MREQRLQQVLANPSRISVARTEDRSIPGGDGTQIGVRIYWPEAFESARQLPLVVSYHGGAFVFGSIETHDPVARAICAHAEAVVISVNYRLAPEDLYPAAAHDAFAALTWAADHAALLGADPARIAVAGDSAGGHLATVVAQLARDAGGPALKFQLLWYPPASMDLSLPSVAENADAPVLTRDAMRFIKKFYFGVSDTGSGRLPAIIEPMSGNLAGLPPAYIATAQYDPLRDGGALYAKLLAEADVPVQLHNGETLVHGYVTYAEDVPAAQEALDLSLDALKAAL